MLWYAMTRYPQVFIEPFYNSGPLDHAFQAFASELMPLWLYHVLASVALASFPVLALLSRRRLLGPALAAAAAAGVAATWGAFAGPADVPARGADARPDVLVLAVDSLRPKEMEASSGSGYRRLAGESLVYDDAYAVMARTFPSWVSMLTGQLPPQHGVRNMFPPPEVLGRKYETLATVLGAQGYDTAVFSDFAGDIFSRIDLGFAHADVPEFSLRSNVKLACWKMHFNLLPYLVASGLMPRMSEFGAFERYADPEILTDRFVDWLARRDPDKPYFGVLFYSATHSPYAPVYPYYRQRGLEGYSGTHRFCKFGQGGHRRTTPEDEEQVRQMFQATVDSVDDQVLRILDALEAAGRLDNTLVVLTADHGENLWEFDRGNSHGDILNGRESLSVPYLFRLPGRAPATHVAQQVSAVTLAPTVLGLLDIPVPTWMDGENLAAQPGFVPRSQKPIYSETGLFFVDPETDFLSDKSIRYASVFEMFEFTAETFILYLAPKFEQESLAAKHRMYLQDRFKLIYVPTRQGALFECFDVVADPNELNDIYRPDHPECNRLKESLIQYMVESGDGERVGDLVVPR
jgi:arylsulfatase A-like enzyme